MKEYNCIQCNNIFKSKKGCKSRIPKYCSSKCYGDSLKLNIKCKNCNQLIQNKHSVSIKKRVYCSKNCQSIARKGTKLNDEWKNKISISRKNSNKCKGENLYNWKGGKETENIRIKESFYKRKKLLKEKLPIEYLKKLIIVQNYKCFFCEKDLHKYKAIEHLTPVTKGGDNFTYNLIYSCKSCNSKKRQKTLEEYSIINKRFDWLDKFDNIYAEAIS